ncbi:MAG: 8-amino-7-oxononanoate synthase [Chlamydiia bacterium]|nr:8-amino-7-oxononanoate synthase [Chlamydiia bacterium]
MGAWGEFRHMAMEQKRGRRQCRRLDCVDVVQPPFLVHQGQTYINFSSNDYLGLSQHPVLKEAAAASAWKLGVGAAASRLVTGNHHCHEELEQELCQWKRAPAALVMGSGYQSNATLLSALASRSSCILLDRLAHQSLIQGALASRAELQRFRHNDLDHLEHLLRSKRQLRTLVVVESLYSMDGDFAPLADILALCRLYGALLYVDDAHGTGVYGDHGRGLCEVEGDDVLVCGTFSKAMGVYGSYLLCTPAWKDFFISHCAGLIYSTALPPPLIAAIRAGIRLIPQLDRQREVLRKHCEEAGRLLRLERGRASQILPFILGGSHEALRKQEELRAEGYWVQAIRPPTVAEGTARLRITLTSQHHPAQIAGLCEVLTKGGSRCTSTSSTAGAMPA